MHRTDLADIRLGDGVPLKLSLAIRWRIEDGDAFTRQFPDPPKYASLILDPKSREVASHVANTYASVASVFRPEREKFTQEVKEALRQKLAEQGITIKEVVLADILFPNNFTDALEVTATKEQEFERIRQKNAIEPEGAKAAQSKATAEGQLLENQSRGYFKKPNQYKDVIIARKQSANFPPTINTVTGGRLIQNFYEDDIRFFGGRIPGPIADDALDYYYYYIERVVLKNDRKVYKLFMKPESSDDPGFVGSIFINDSTFELIQVELELNRAANIGGIFDTISIFQQFTSYDDIYMPVDYRLFAKGNVLGLVDFGVELNTILYDYKINPELSDDIFTKAIVTVLTDADKKDPLYWTTTQTIQNTKEETTAYYFYRFPAIPESTLSSISSGTRR